MKKSIIKGIVYGAVFFIAMIVIDKIMNTGNVDMTAEMSPATFPVLYMEIDGQRYNELHGYADSMEVAYMRNNITALSEDRSTGFALKKYDSKIRSIAYEVRSVDGGRLIEDTLVEECSEDEEYICGQIALKDLIEENVEYALIFLVELENGQTLRYYTRAIWTENYNAAEKIAYVVDFNNKTFDKSAAKNLTKYLETNAEGDNTTFHKVNIHSSLSQVSWGDLNVSVEMTPVPELIELASQTASLRMHYVVSVGEDKERIYYDVTEYYRIRYTPERTYLLDFEREMTQFFEEEEGSFVNDKIVLGIADPEIPFVESEDGNNFAFIIQNKLCSYSVTDKGFGTLFCFYDENQGDERTIYNHHKIRILNMDEAGNVEFAVVGYMNRGRYEGQVGVQVYKYDRVKNTIEEVVFIPYTKGEEILLAEMENLLYSSREGYLYLCLEDMVYEINLESKRYETIVSILQDDTMQASASHSVIAWQKGEDPNACEAILLMNLGTKEKTEILAPKGEYLRPLGFMGEDLIYGYAKAEDVEIDAVGRVTFPMYRLCILGTDGTIQMQYMQQGIYVLDLRVDGNQIRLSRAVKSEDGELEETTDDQIMNNQIAVAGKNKVGSVATSTYEKIVQITVKKTLEPASIKMMHPKEVLFEGGREVTLQPDSETNRYYVYGLDGKKGIYRSPANAVNLAYEISGSVIGEDGKYVWIKGNRVSRNQIMAITAASVTEEKDSVAICLDTMLKFEGVIRNSEYLLAQGETIFTVLEKNLPDAQILDLKGCNLESMLYYVNRDIPVFASLSDGSAVLIVGFNEYNIVVMNPTTGKLYKKGMNDSRQWLEENGNSFITYVK